MTDAAPAKKKRKKAPKVDRTWRDHPDWTEKTRSERWLIERGWTVGNVETRFPHSFVTTDLYGYADLQAMRKDCPHLHVQATSNNGGNMSARRLKIEAEPRAALWLGTGGAIEVHAWNKPNTVGKRPEWTLRIGVASLNEHGAIVWSEIEEVKP